MEKRRSYFRISELVELLGEETTDKLMRILGGQEVCVPTTKRVTARNRLSQILDLAVFGAFYEKYKGKKLYIPKGPYKDTDKKHRKQQCLAMLENGQSPISISHALNYSYRAVIKIKQRM